jgi:transposase-like protein
MVHNKRYDYICNACGEEFEYAFTTTRSGMIGSYSDTPKPPTCPSCKSTNCVKVIRPVEFGFSKEMKKMDMR